MRYQRDHPAYRDHPERGCVYGLAIMLSIIFFVGVTITFIVTGHWRTFIYIFVILFVISLPRLAREIWDIIRGENQ